MKPVIAIAIGFVIATAGSTGAKVMLTKPAPDTAAALDSTAFDTTEAQGADTATADSTLLAHAGDSLPRSAPADSAPIRLAVPPGPVATLTPAGAPAPAVKAAAPANDSMAAQSNRRLAKVFGAMPAREAGRVLTHMSDADAQIILDYVGAKQAAAILATLPPERVAALSKAAIRGGGAGK